MTDLRQAAQQALEALAIADNIALVGAAYTPKSIDLKLRKIRDSATALRTALEQQAEPVAWDVFELRLYGAPQEKQHRVLWVDRYTYPDGSTPDLDGLLDAAKKEGGIDGGAKTLHVRPLYTTPPQQKAEPVAWMDREGDLYKMPEIKNWAPPHTMLYTAPPQRKWQGLTDEDVNRESAMIAQKMKLAFHAGMYVAQQILKEKNT